MDNLIKFKSVDTLQSFMEHANRFEPGEMVLITDTKQLMVYTDDGKWVEIQEIPREQTEAMNLYEFNRAIVSQLPAKTALELQPCIDLINEYGVNKMNSHYMLLCKEISYYTIFTKDAIFHDFPSLGSAVISCAQDIGKIVSVEKADNDAIEIWVNTENDGARCMYFFDAADFVVTYEG